MLQHPLRSIEAYWVVWWMRMAMSGGCSNDASFATKVDHWCLLLVVSVGKSSITANNHKIQDHPSNVSLPTETNFKSIKRAAGLLIVKHWCGILPCDSTHRKKIWYLIYCQYKIIFITIIFILDEMPERMVHHPICINLWQDNISMFGLFQFFMQLLHYNNCYFSYDCSLSWEATLLWAEQSNMILLVFTVLLFLNMMRMVLIKYLKKMRQSGFSGNFIHELKKSGWKVSKFGLEASRTINVMFMANVT